MSIGDSIRWVSIFERELRHFPDFSESELRKARMLEKAHITEVDQPVFNRIYGKIERIQPQNRGALWIPFLGFLEALGWSKDACLFKSLFYQDISEEEKADQRRINFIERAAKNSKKHDQTADRITSAFGKVGAAFWIFVMILAFVYWEAALGLLSLFIMIAIFLGIIAFFAPAVRPAMAFFYIWRAFK